MKVLVVSNGYPPRGRWGTEFYTRELVRGLARRGHDVRVLHPVRETEREHGSIETAEQDGVPVLLLAVAPQSKRAFERSYADDVVDAAFAGVLDAWRPDVVHFTYLLHGLSLGMPPMCASRGIASVLTLTDYGLLCHRGQMFDHRLERCGGPHPPARCARCIREPSKHDGTALGVLAKRVAVRALAAVGGAGVVVTTRDVARREERVRAALDALDRLIAPSPPMADAFARFGVESEKLEELVYALDEAPYEVARPEPARGDDSDVRFGFLGQFAPHKGLETLLQAVAILDARAPESLAHWHVRLYGSPAGGRHRRYAERALERWASPRVRVCEPFGPDEAPRVLAQLHALVLPSLWDENAPLSVLQARAAGVPVIGSQVPGIVAVVDSGAHGRLVPPREPGSLADAMSAVILGRVGRSRAGTPLSLPRHLEEIERIYRQAELRRAELWTRSERERA